MKRFFSLVLCFCMIISAAPAAMAAPASVAPAVTNAKALYDPAKGLEWLANLEEVEKDLEKAASSRQDLSFYDMARESIIIRLGERIAHVRGYETYIDKENEQILAFEENGAVYLPLEFITTQLSIASEWDAVVGQTTVKGTKTVSVRAGSKNAFVDGEIIVLNAAPVMKHDYLFVPIEVISDATGKSVLYDERGTVIITSKTGHNLLKQEHWDKLAADDFKMEREKIVHPQPYETGYWMMSSGNRKVMRYTDEQLNTTIAPYLEMSYRELAKHVDDAYASALSIGHRPSFERAAACMGIKYLKEPDEDLALRVLIMLFHSALGFDDLPKDGEQYGRFYNIQYASPTYLYWAYDQIYHSPMWDIFSERYGHDIRQVVYTHYSTVFDYIAANRRGASLGNYPTDVGNQMGAAVILDNPDYVRYLMGRFNAAINPATFYADGMWYEGSFDYGKQMTGNVVTPTIILESYRDPLGYVDEEYGISLDGTFDVEGRWSGWLYIGNGLGAKNIYPDGSPVAVHDTHWQNVEKNLANNTIKEANLKNHEMNHFGLYSLKYGNTEEAQQINILAQGTSSVSHQHSSPLAISYYTAGMEVLPDQGYPTPTSLHRYTHTAMMGHNTTYVGAGGSTPLSGSFWIRPNVYAYDDGSHNNKQVQLIEAANLMPDYHKIDDNRRMLMMIATDENHSYAVDVHRVKAKGVTESYMHQTEDEDVEFETSLQLEEPFKGTIKEWLPSKNIYSGHITSSAYSDVIKNTRGATTSDDFWFTWKGKRSGTTLKTWVKAEENTVIGFSDFPTIRRTEKDAKLKNNFPGYHYYRKNMGRVGDPTTYANLYEGWRENEAPKVLNVTWIDPEDDDKRTTMLKVELEDYYDYIYTSLDMEERKLEDFTMSGYANIVRVNKETGEIVYTYLYGEGTIKRGDFVATGNEKLSYRVLQAQGSRASENNIPNELKVEGTPTRDIEGYWCNVTFPDGSGKAFEVKRVNQSIVTVHNDPGFYMNETGPVFTAYPLYFQEGTDLIAKFASAYTAGMVQRYEKGDVTFNIDRPVFTKY